VDLDGKVAIVTGASRGVGAATARLLGAAGARVVCAARSTDEQPMPTPGTLDGTVAAIVESGGSALAVPTNLAVDADIERMVATAVEAFGGLDILINNAAITFPGDLDLPMKRFELIFRVDVYACVYAAQLAVTPMRARGGGAIVNVSSLAGLNYFPGLMAYGMAKAALEHHTMSLAAQLRADQIAVNTFRIDVPVASEGFVANAPGLDHSNWEPSEVAAEGIVWMLRQPPDYTGRQEGMAALRAREGIMASRVPHPVTPGGGVTTESHLRPPA
jgi:citronellol/citronellal dehydrogenase